MQVEKSQAEWAMELNDVRLALARSEERLAKLEYENGWLLKGMASLTGHAAWKHCLMYCSPYCAR